MAELGSRDSAATGGEDHWMLLEDAAERSRMAPYTGRFESVGRALPEHRVTTDELMASTLHRTRIDLERLTGVRERRKASDGEDSVTLAVDAARDCLSRSRHDAAELDIVISCSISRQSGGGRHRYEPPLSLSIKEAIGASQARSLDLSNACAGMLTAVFVLNDMIRLGDVRCGLVVSGENITGLTVNAAHDVHNILSDQLASLTLGDAGAATVVDRAPEGEAGIVLAGFTTLAEHSRLCLGAPNRSRPGGSMHTNARALQRAAIEDSLPLLGELLEMTGTTLDQIDHFIPHQTSVRAIHKGVDEMRRRFGSAPADTVITVDRYGNTASTTHFVALAELLEHGKLKSGERILLVSLASGLEVGFVVFEVGALAGGRDESWER